MLKQQNTLGFLGPKGTHSEAVALYLNYKQAGDWNLFAYDTIYEAIQAVADGVIERCVVPVENSIEGSINITLDTLAHEVDLQVEQEIVWTVHNQLMTKYPKDVITTILSHPQPLAQCREYLKKNYAGIEIRQTASTARAAEIVASGPPGYAAIGTQRAGELYGLTTMDTEIQDTLTNCTRFFVLTKIKQAVIAGANKTSLVCQIDGKKAGSLCAVLSEFAKRDVNMTRIESRPARTGLGEYIFFFEVDGSTQEQNVNAAILAIQQKSLWLKNLGSFPVTYVDENIKK
ncbi:prephenate dehydratase [Propionispira raffinosivorans]|uniref:prephenate dehydratase n=1 Tax=Propionispira raffinosivorans TaxID=86959 RepID=UPI00037A6047|nr:prephenate dehydratase [Propionispira raffinosivorans]